MGIKNAELCIKVKGGHFEHIIEIKFILMHYYKYSSTKINKKLSICTLEVIFGYVRSDPKINFSFGSPCKLNNNNKFKHLLSTESSIWSQKNSSPHVYILRNVYIIITVLGYPNLCILSEFSRNYTEILRFYFL